MDGNTKQMARFRMSPGLPHRAGSPRGWKPRGRKHKLTHKYGINLGLIGPQPNVRYPLSHSFSACIESGTTELYNSPSGLARMGWWMRGRLVYIVSVTTNPQILLTIILSTHSQDVIHKIHGYPTPRYNNQSGLPSLGLQLRPAAHEKLHTLCLEISLHLHGHHSTGLVLVS